MLHILQNIPLKRNVAHTYNMSEIRARNGNGQFHAKKNTMTSFCCFLKKDPLYSTKFSQVTFIESFLIFLPIILMYS